MAEKETIKQLLLERAFKELHRFHVVYGDEEGIPQNKCRTCNKIVQETVEKAMASPEAKKLEEAKPEEKIPDSFYYEDMGMHSAYDAFESDDPNA